MIKNQSIFVTLSDLCISLNMSCDKKIMPIVIESKSGMDLRGEGGGRWTAMPDIFFQFFLRQFPHFFKICFDNSEKIDKISKNGP